MYNFRHLNSDKRLTVNHYFSGFRQIGLMSSNIEIKTLGCLISFIVDANSREVIIIRLRKLS